MRRKFFNQAGWLTMALLLGIVPLARPQNLPSGSLSDPAFQALSLKWSYLPLPVLLEAAQAGDAAAEYFYWSRAVAAADQAENQDYARQRFFFRQMSADQVRAAKAKWKSASAAELDEAVKSGDVGAEMIAAELAQAQDAQKSGAAFPWLKKAADQGFAAAEFDLAIRYLGERGGGVVAIDVPTGLKYLRRAADHGWTVAQYQLGMLYLHGKRLPPDFSAALDYLRRAADQNGPNSQYELARLYAQGVGEPRSEADSPVSLLRKSARQGNLLAMQALGDRYRTGLGVPVDYVTAIQLYQAANNSGKQLRSFRSPDDFSQWVDEALEPRTALMASWANFARVLSVYLKATQKADVQAMDQLGDWYQAGQFVPHDPAKAFYWYDLAAGHGSTYAIPRRNALQATLRPEQIMNAANPDVLNP